FGVDSGFASTRGLVSNGVSAPATLNGGDGEDTFEFFRNLAPVTVSGGTGDDTVILHSLPAGSVAAVPYAMNGPIHLDAGGGEDLLVAIGTEFADLYVVHADTVQGSGLHLSHR